MTGSLKPYPAYKESGSSWIGPIPSTWEVQNLRTLIGPHAERNHPELPLLSVARERGVFIRSLTGEDDNHNIIPEDLSNYKVARAGNLVINKMKAWQGSMGIAPCDGVVSPAYYVFEFRIADSGFGETLLRSKPYVAHFGQASDGVRIGQWDLNIARMREIPVLIPSHDEQAAIVQYLDYMDRHIRHYIRCKQKLIKLLEEQKRAITHDAVTRGIDGDVHLKPSGVEWIGDVPEHWRISRVKAEFQSLNRHRIPLSSTERGEMSLRTYDYYGASGVIDKVDNFLFEGELLLIAEDGANLVLRNLPLAIIARGRYWVNNHAHILKVRRGNIEYLAAMMETLNYQPWISGAAQPKLTQDRLMSITIAVPSPEEQARIAAFLQVATQPLGAAIDHARHEITLLREYRSRLIADVVTGKLDVREVAVSIPHEISQEDMILDEMKSFAENGLEDDDSGLEDSLEEVEA